MCGVAGVLDFGGTAVDPGFLYRMIEPIRHRGPDDIGIHTDKGVGLAHARLSILDLACGHQPMHEEGGSLSIVFNGEIFNYLELRKDLIARGHRFRTRSDTEVLLRLYQDQGEDCVRHLNGQWAFAIWDSRRERIFLSRDRLGVRPLFYAQAGRTFLFASEIKSLFAFPPISREIDLIALDQIFTFWVTIPPRTAFEGIRELPPGHSMTVQDGRIAVASHWALDYGTAVEGALEVPASEKECGERLLELLTDATRLRLRSEVPVGAYLSGGLDSTVVAALVKKFSGSSLKTFSVSFDRPEFDESPYQREAVRFLGTDHQEVRCTREDIVRVFPEVVRHAEKPILRTAPAPLYVLSKKVREQGYKVVLTGEGADEVLGGYDIFKEAKIRRFCAARPGSRLRPLLLKKLYPYLSNLQSQSSAYLSLFFQADPSGTESDFFSHLPRWNLTASLKKLFSEAVRSQIASYDGYQELREALPPGYSAWDSFCQAQYLETRYLLPGYILSSQGDRVAMAHSVEGRFPFLDPRVVDFAARIPPRLKMKVLDEKYLLKRSATGLVPSSILARSKQPYRAPEGESFFNGERREYVDALLAPERIEQDGLFDPAMVQRVVTKFREGRAIGIKDNMALIGVLSTQLLVHQFVRNSTEDLLHAPPRAGIAQLCHG
jgi:asparagine synthase (glutamine-hydrolysing)